MNNECYKTYTMKSSLGRIDVTKQSLERIDAEENACDNEPPTAVRVTRSKASPWQLQRAESDESNLKIICVICGSIRQKGIHNKYRISDFDRAKQFLEAAVFYQDVVYLRTCNLQDVNDVFGANLYCHKSCIKNYLIQYERNEIETFG